MKTRKEHMDWCKKRALEYCDKGDHKNALASMMSDLRKHDETANHPAIGLTMGLMIAGHLNDLSSVRDHIIGFN